MLSPLRLGNFVRHDVRVSGLAHRLRPVAEDDAEFIVALRNNERLNRYLHTGAHTVEEQLVWLDAYFLRPGDWYFIIERMTDGVAEGVAAIYGLDDLQSSAEWGRWIVRPPSLAAVESAWLIYRTAFEVLRLTGVYCRTAAANAQVVAFHDACCLSERRELPKHFEFDGNSMNAVEHCLALSDWPRVSGRLQVLASSIARRVQRA